MFYIVILHVSETFYIWIRYKARGHSCSILLNKALPMDGGASRRGGLSPTLGFHFERFTNETCHMGVGASPRLPNPQIVGQLVFGFNIQTGHSHECSAIICLALVE